MLASAGASVSANAGSRVTVTDDWPLKTAIFKKEKQPSECFVILEDFKFKTRVVTILKFQAQYHYPGKYSELDTIFYASWIKNCQIIKRHNIILLT